MTVDLQGEKAFVTGGTSGIGRSIVEHLTERGAQVAFTGRDSDRGLTVAAGTRATFIRADAVDREQCDTAMEQALSSLGGRIDIFVACAAIVFESPLLSTSEPIFRELIEVNLTSTFRYSRACFAIMKAQRSGTIILIVSDSALRGIHHIPAYSISKSGVLVLSEALAAEAAPFGVRVNAICPGAVFPGVQSTPEGYESHAEDASTWGAAPSGRHGTGSDISQVVLWLASDAASHVNGAMLRVDGAASAAMRGGARA
jgi:NAD(P)-dependent dehydrogenase (short-subunit alcohol dehydrogenase family)